MAFISDMLPIAQSRCFSTSSGRQIQVVDKIKKLAADRKKPVVSVIKLHGTIAPTMGKSFNNQGRLNLTTVKPMVDTAFGHKSLEAVMLSVNSPGGSPSQCELIADYIDAKVKEKKVPVYSFVEDYAASGGYWLACSGQKIFVTRSSLVGSIGVIFGGLGFHELIQKWGIERRLYTAGKRDTYA